MTTSACRWHIPFSQALQPFDGIPPAKTQPLLHLVFSVQLSAEVKKRWIGDKELHGKCSQIIEYIEYSYVPFLLHIIEQLPFFSTKKTNCIAL